MNNIKTYNEHIGNDIFYGIVKGADLANRGFRNVIKKAAPVLEPVVRTASKTFNPGQKYKLLNKLFKEIKGNFNPDNMELINSRGDKYLIYTHLDYEIKLLINQFGWKLLKLNGEFVNMNEWLLNEMYEFFVQEWTTRDKYKTSGQIFSVYDPYGEEKWDE